MNFTSGPFMNRIYGVVIGIVTDNKHPDGAYSVKVKFPWVMESDTNYTSGPADSEDFFSTWARITQVWAGKDRGVFFLPEVDDEVLVAFEHGDLRRPIVLGSLWNGKDAPYSDNNGQDGKNNFTTMLSRSGHVIQFMDDAENKKEKIIIQTKIAATDTTTDHKSRPGHFIVLDETDGEKKIEIYDGKQKNFILIDSENDKIMVESTDGNLEVTTGADTIFAVAGNFELKADGDIMIEAGGAIEMKSGSTTDIEAGSTCTIKGGPNVEINP